MMRNYKMNKRESDVMKIKEMYQVMIGNGVSTEEKRQLIKNILKMQKEDGFWSVIDDYRVDSDMRVDYVYVPTYYATAILINADLSWNLAEDSLEKKALLKGLERACGRRLAGHGFTATASLLEALDIYKNAGLYEWMKSNQNQAPAFCDIIHDHIKYFKKALVEGNTFSDWNVDFKEKFEEEVITYEKVFEPYVWYAAYGSNINKDRFMKYINRCSNTTPPVEDKAYIIPYDLYFASISGLWERKAVAFLNDTKEGMTWGRIYKISLKQFQEIQKMEGPKYEKKVLIGEIDGLPIYTFTSNHVRFELRGASVKYLDVIRTGLKELYPNKTDLVLDLYLYSKGTLLSEDIEVLRYIRNSQHGVSLSSITSIGSNMTEIKRSIKRLYYYGFIKQDKRSIHRGDDALDDKSIVYTVEEKRELCDIILVMK